MKILLYQEPTTAIYLPYPVSKVCKDHLYDWLAKYLITFEDVEVMTVVSELTYIQNQQFHDIDILKPICFKDEYLTQIFPNCLSIQEMFLKIFNSDLSDEEYTKFQEIIKKILPDFEPDIVIDFQIHNDLLKKAYPNALHLLVENGLFSRPPFPRTLRYEPIHFLNGFLNKYENEIRNFSITKHQQETVKSFQQKLRQLIDYNNPIKEALIQLRSQYRYLLLCPVPTDNIYKETKYDDQYLYLLDILNKIPEDIGLIITFHDDCSSQLNAGIINTLQQKYKNLIYFPVTDNSFVSQSLNFFEYCDAIINMHTMTGTQAMLWDLKIISLDKRYSKWFCDKQGLDNLEEFLASPKKDKSNMIYWYMTHFSVFEQSMKKPNWYYNYFKTKLEKFRKDGITFELFEQIEDFNDISEYVINHLNEVYGNLVCKQPTFLQTIFSVRNEGNHKVVRFLGLKMKFRRKNAKR